MDTKQFENISLLGRIAYGIMCAESYVLAKFPDRNWKPLFEKLWSLTKSDVYWDDWADEIIEVIPEYLYEFPDFESSDFEHLTKAEYETFSTLQKGLPDEWDTIIMRIRDMEDIYVYTNIPGTGKESLTILSEICKILTDNGIALPNPKSVAFSSFAEMNGRGNSFDAKPLSKIL